MSETIHMGSYRVTYTGREPPKPPEPPRRFTRGAVLRVPSNTKPGVHYTITIGDQGGVKCDCPGFWYRRDCTHARKVRESKP